MLRVLESLSQIKPTFGDPSQMYFD